MQLLIGSMFNFFCFTNNKFMRNPRYFSDMAVEFCKARRTYQDGTVKFYEVRVDEKMSKKLDRPCGNYTTVETSCVMNSAVDEYAKVSKALAGVLGDYLRDCNKIMVVGLGNPDLAADSLGDRAFKRIKVTRQFDREKYLCALTPNVLGMTGIESFDIIAAVVDRIKPDALIVIDSLTAAAPHRIASAFQVTDSGITPGSGVENHRPRIDRASLGIKVVSIGVPLVVYASTIARAYCAGTGDSNFDMVVTPKDVDVLVEHCAGLIADAINSAFA